MHKLLVVQDDPAVTEYLVELFEKQGNYKVTKAFGLQSAINSLNKEAFDLLILEYQDPLLKFIDANCPDTKRIILSKESSIRNSVEAMKRGACDYVTHDATPDEIMGCVKGALNHSKTSSLAKPAKNGASAPFDYGNIIGKDPAFLQVFKIIEKVSKTDSTVLITGESGTGKEVIARAIHFNSLRKKKPLIVINCGAIPGELLESELFGHEKGAFTSAHRTRIGRFELANEGTIFLDEIGDMSPNLQVKLLRIIQEQTFERVGGTNSIHVDVRILAATNKDLTNSIKEGTFREDLYYRLNVIPIIVPPLRQRKSDIPLLADYFLKRLSERRGHPLKTYSKAAMDVLMNYDWPGNIRELENIMERLFVLVENDIIDVEDLSEKIRSQPQYQPDTSPMQIETGIDFNDAVENYQKNLILQALNQTNWVKAKAADLLKINRTTLVEKIKKLKLEPQPEPRTHL